MNRPSTDRAACEPDESPRDDFGPEAIAQFRKHNGAVLDPPWTPPVGFPVHRHVRRSTNETIPWVVQHRIGRNDPCPCECGRKAKRCPRGLALIEAARWA